ncbi:DnaJ domain-containing protein [Haloarcula litorea]|uniref:DnaJ domain-containing protein n=1 Tax=Haloarcula litorea TaxID=3032579 RepID=UPI0023E8851E|nr:DnaJ domain-containing protein [Halomicroarcula sp. GDY20]
MTRTFYDVLGVSEDATTEEIEAAYRERLKESHPDVSDAADARESTKRIVAARDVLVDEAERERYDRIGHAAYVGDTSAGARDGETNSNPAEAARRAGYGRESDERTGGENGGTRERDGRGRARERRRRERRASERVRDADTGGEGTSEPTGPDSTGEAATDAGAAATSGPRGDTSTVGGYASGGESPAWAASATYSVRDSAGPDRDIRRLVPTGRELTLLGITFALYPVLLLSAVLPAFPVVVNAIVAGCALLVVGYLQSMPRIAILAFGGWSVLTPLVLLWLNVGLLSLVGVIALCGTWLPFGFSLLTAAVLAR